MSASTRLEARGLGGFAWDGMERPNVGLRRLDLKWGVEVVPGPIPPLQSHPRIRRGLWPLGV